MTDETMPGVGLAGDWEELHRQTVYPVHAIAEQFPSR